MIVATVSVATAIVPFAIGVAIIIATVILLAWTSAARNAYSGPGTVIFSRSPVLVVAGAAVMAAAAFAAPFVGVDLNNGAFDGVLLVGLFGFGFFGQFLLPAFTFYVADYSGLTKQLLFVKKTLPWQAIDWVYPARKTTNYRTYGIKVGQSSEDSLVVEAGPRQQIKIVLKSWLIGGDSSQLLAAMQQRARSAEVGFDKSPVVQQRRAVGVGPGMR